MYKGQLEGFPKEVVDKMLYYQVQQGNKEDVTVFESNSLSNKVKRGFAWVNTTEEYGFWEDIIVYKNFNLFFQKYPKNNVKLYPKVMLVSNDRINWVKRVVFMEKCGYFIAWSSAETPKECESAMRTSPWKYAKDIEEPKIVEVTLEDVAKAMNISPELLRIKK